MAEFPFQCLLKVQNFMLPKDLSKLVLEVTAGVVKVIQVG